MAEQLTYVDCLITAAKYHNSCLKMAFCMGFALSNCSIQINRLKKPFNPLLGETYEYHDKKRNFRLFTE